jgi:hypothetical protein
MGAFSFQRSVFSFRSNAVSIRFVKTAGAPGVGIGDFAHRGKCIQIEDRDARLYVSSNCTQPGKLEGSPFWKIIRRVLGNGKPDCNARW